MSGVLLSTAYLPNIEYFSYLLNSEPVIIEAQEHFQKQSYRNRCEILSANGKLDLVIPLKKKQDKEIISQKEISYAENWQIRHWRAITSAYKNSPYFDYFEDELSPFYSRRTELLLDYNTQIVQAILKILRLNKQLYFTESYEKETGFTDLRDKIHPKKEVRGVISFKPYSQVFSEKMAFIENLSIIDLLFNKGLETKDYLAL